MYQANDVGVELINAKRLSNATVRGFQSESAAPATAAHAHALAASVKHRPTGTRLQMGYGLELVGRYDRKACLEWKGLITNSAQLGNFAKVSCLLPAHRVRSKSFNKNVFKAKWENA
jgi:hypothetical protein